MISRSLLRRSTFMNSETRLYIQEINARDCCCHDFDYYSCIALGDVSLSKGERTKLYCPDDTEYDKFITVSYFDANDSDGTCSLVSNLPIGASVLRRYYDRNCYFDASVHLGYCDNPAIPTSFEKALLFKNIRITSYNLTALTARARTDITPIVETAEFTFETLTEVSKPTFTLYEIGILEDGPIIDSFSFCDSDCCLCKRYPGHYYVQLVECDGTTNCYQARMLATKDNGKSFFIAAVLGEVALDTLISSNSFLDALNYYALLFDGIEGETLGQLLQLALKSISIAELGTNRILSYDTYGGTIFMSGDNGKIYKYESSTGEFRLISYPTVLHPQREIVSISTCDGETFVAGTLLGNVYFGSEDSLQNITIDGDGNAIHRVQMTSCCSFVVAAGVNGGYYYCDGKVEKICGLSGAITAFSEFVNGVGYAATNNGTNITIWLTIDYGRNWSAVDTQLSTDYYVNTISLCEDNLNQVTVAGSKGSGATTPLQQIDYNIEWQNLGTGFVLLNLRG